MYGFKNLNRMLVVFITLISMLLPEIGLSLGLGQIKLQSYLNEPLEAEIELMGSLNVSPKQLLVSLASAEDFKKAQLARPYFLTKLRFQVIKEEKRLFIRATSDEPIKQPYLEFLVVVSWPEGRLVRGYTLLLDPMPLEGGLERPKTTSKASALTESSALKKVTEKLSKNLYSIKPRQVASAEATNAFEEVETDNPSLAQVELEPLFEETLSAADMDKTPTIERALPVIIESTQKAIKTVPAPKKAATQVKATLPSGELTLEEKEISQKTSSQDRMWLASGFGLLISVAITIWILKRARESLPANPVLSDPLQEKPLFDEEMAIKLSLSKQYFAIKDYESARKILDEIVLRGNSQEIERARNLLEKIPV